METEKIKKLPQYPKMKRAGIFSLGASGIGAVYMAVLVLWVANWERLQIKDFDFGMGGTIFGIVLLFSWVGSGLLAVRFLFWGIRFLRAGSRVSSFGGWTGSLWTYLALGIGLIFGISLLSLGKYLRFGYVLLAYYLLGEGYMLFCLIYESRALRHYPRPQEKVKHWFF